MTELKISSNGDSVFSNNPDGLTSEDLSVLCDDNFYIFRGSAITKSYSIVPDNADLETECNVTSDGLVVSFFDDFLQDNVQSGFKFILNPIENLPSPPSPTPSPLSTPDEGEETPDEGGDTEEIPVENNETTTSTTDTTNTVDEELTFKYRL